MEAVVILLFYGKSYKIVFNVRRTKAVKCLNRWPVFLTFYPRL